jgi:hypothetical protein
MVLRELGISVGDLQLTLEKQLVSPGELVVGTVKLDLTHPVRAKRLVVGLTARQRAVGLQPGQQGLQLSYRNDKVWDFHLEVDGERDYRPGEVKRFELLVPRDAKQTNFNPPGGLLGEVVQALSFLSNVKRFPLEWRVYAFLDRPWALNPKGEVQLQLRERDEITTPSGRPLTPPPEPKPKLKKKKTTSPKRKPAKMTTKTRAKKKPARRGTD